MWPDQVSNPGPLTYESGALPTALRGPASIRKHIADTNVVNDVIISCSEGTFLLVPWPISFLFFLLYELKNKSFFKQSNQRYRMAFTVTIGITLGFAFQISLIRS